MLSSDVYFYACFAGEKICFAGLPNFFTVQATVFAFEKEIFALGIGLSDAVDASNHEFLSRIYFVYSRTIIGRCIRVSRGTQ